jgi:hypothetical protein
MINSSEAEPLHVLMTRFNLATVGRESTIRNRPDWLAERFELFEKYCLPSVAAQQAAEGQEPKFTWIVYFDTDTPQIFKDRIRALQRKVPFEAYYTGLFPASGWRISLEKTLGPLPSMILTSRLDNDDALAVDYMARTRAAAADPVTGSQAWPRLGIVLSNGFIRSGSRVFALEHRSNAFISWLERTENPTEFFTAMGIRHMDAQRFGLLKQVEGSGGWLQVVHGTNVSNKVRGRRVQPSALDGRFHRGALDGLDHVTLPELLLENTLVAPLRAARDRIISAASGLRRRPSA